MKIFQVVVASSVLAILSSGVQAQEDFAALSEKGKELYFEQVSCWICHGDNAEGRVGPTLHAGATPLEIQEQLDSNPQMAIIVSELDPDVEDLVALSVFIGGLGGNTYDSETVEGWRSELTAVLDARGDEMVFAISPRDQQILDIQSFDTVVADWTRKANTGSLKRDYEVQVLQEYENGEQIFFPEPEKLYFVEVIGTGGSHAPDPSKRTNATGVVVGDSQTKEILASVELPAELRGAVHTTVVSPDGKYVYMIGPSGNREGWNGSVLRTPSHYAETGCPDSAAC